MARLIGFDKKGITRARRRGSPAHSNDAIHVAFIPSNNQIRLKLRNRTEVVIPVRAIATFGDVPKSELVKIRLSPVGDALELPGFDINVSVGSLVRTAVLGRDPYAVAGSVASDAKAAAARVNGKKGGRPKSRVTRAAV